MIVIVGLGNIGEQYKLTKHNVGFLIVDYVAQYYGFPEAKSNFKSLISEKKIDNISVVLIKPQTYMNHSGTAVQALCSYYKIPPDDIIIVQDDVDLNFGVLRYKTNSGDGGQRGIRDIQAKLGKNIHRIKVGIDRPPANYNTSDYVLSKFNKQELQQIENICETFAINLTHLITKNFPTFIQNLNEVNF